jgi:hypothetical protein
MFSCNGDDDNSITPSLDEYITWKSSGTEYQNGTIYKYLDYTNFEISEDAHNFFLEVETSTNITEGMIINASETSTELSFGFDGAGNSDIYFYGGYVKFTSITDEYVEGEFIGNNAKEVDDSVSPAIVTPSTVEVTNGKFRIKR